MTSLPSGITAITLFVADLTRSKAFYERVFGLKAVYEDDDATTFRLENLLLNVLKRSAADELIEPAPQGDEGAATRLLLTITVTDADAACATLREHGVELLNGPMDRPWGVRTAAFLDPDGHAWEIAAPIAKA